MIVRAKDLAVYIAQHEDLMSVKSYIQRFLLLNPESEILDLSVSKNYYPERFTEQYTEQRYLLKILYKRAEG